MGDPAGIGPEVVLKALAPSQALGAGRATCVLVGDARWLRGLARRWRVPWRWSVVSSPRSDDRAPRFQLWDAVRVPSGVRPGTIQRAAGRIALAALDRAIELVRCGHADGVVTAPVSKAAIALSRPGWIGHTEHLADAFGVKQPIMMFVTERFAVSLVTTHCSLADAVRTVTAPRVTRTILVTAEALTRGFGIRRPRLAVASLNPHAGESGLLGTAERRWMSPLLRRLQRRTTAKVSGPWPADSLFMQAAAGRYDGVIAMYHDQGLIPVKLLAWEQAVNVTLGIPCVRTSPSHGTAFDLAGRGLANPQSMAHAITLATMMVRHRANGR